MNGDGTPDYGSCIAKKRNAQSYWFVTDVVGSMTQSKGTSQGTFFNTKDMTPAGRQRGLPQGARLPARNRPSTARRTSSTSTSATRGRCSPPANARSTSTGATSARSPSTRSTSKVIGKCGAAIMPGSKEVLELGYRQARGLHRGHLPERHRRREPRALRGLRRLERRHQRQGRGQGEGRGLRLLLLHDPAGAVERRRHHRQDRLQPLPHLAARLQRRLEEGGHERGRRPRSISAPSRTA